MSESELDVIQNTNISEGGESSKRKRSDPELINDHDYMLPKGIKTKKNSKNEDMYLETVEVLKDIRNILHTGLASLNETLDRNLKNICTVIGNKKEN